MYKYIKLIMNRTKAKDPKTDNDSKLMWNFEKHVPDNMVNNNGYSLGRRYIQKLIGSKLGKILNTC